MNAVEKGAGKLEESWECGLPEDRSAPDGEQSAGLNAARAQVRQGL